MDGSANSARIEPAFDAIPLAKLSGAAATVTSSHYIGVIRSGSQSGGLGPGSC